MLAFPLLVFVRLVSNVVSLSTQNRQNVDKTANAVVVKCKKTTHLCCIKRLVISRIMLNPRNSGRESTGSCFQRVELGPNGVDRTLTRQTTIFFNVGCLRNRNGENKLAVVVVNRFLLVDGAHVKHDIIKLVCKLVELCNTYLEFLVIVKCIIFRNQNYVIKRFQLFVIETLYF